MRWINVKSVEELKALGNFRYVTKVIKEDVGDMVIIKGKSWEEVYNNIVEFRILLEDINKAIQRDENYNK